MHNTQTSLYPQTPQALPERVYNLSVIDVGTYDRRVRTAFRQLGLPENTILESLPDDWQWLIVDFACDLSMQNVLEAEF